MKFVSILVLGLLLHLSSIGQFKDLIIVEIDNKGKVPGRTFQVYVELTNDSDHVHMVMGDDVNDLFINSTKPFYQNEFAGALSSNMNPKIEAEFEEAKYDSYFTIGRTNSKNNFVSNFNMDFTDFDVGDAPSFFSIFTIGFLIPILAILVEIYFKPSFLIHMFLWVPATLLFCFFTLTYVRSWFIHWEYRIAQTDKENK